MTEQPPYRTVTVHSYSHRFGCNVPASFYIFRAESRDDAARAARAYHIKNGGAWGEVVTEVRVYGTCCDCPHADSLQPDGTCRKHRYGTCGHAESFTTH